MAIYKYTVVAAEDEELLLGNLVKKIEQTGLGFRVIGTALTGSQAYDIVKEKNPDLLITDIRMPVMDGLQLIEKVRNHYPLTRFIITSGYSDFDYAKSAIRLRVSEYLLKPVEPDELYSPCFGSEMNLKRSAANTLASLMPR